jgi:hypothetical protein
MVKQLFAGNAASWQRATGGTINGFAAELDGAAAVVITPPQHTLNAAFSVRGTPAFYLIGSDGRIEARDMAAQAPAAMVSA